MSKHITTLSIALAIVSSLYLLSGGTVHGAQLDSIGTTTNNYISGTYAQQVYPYGDASYGGQIAMQLIVPTEYVVMDQITIPVTYRNQLGTTTPAYTVMRMYQLDTFDDDTPTLLQTSETVQVTRDNEKFEYPYRSWNDNDFKTYLFGSSQILEPGNIYGFTLTEVATYIPFTSLLVGMVYDNTANYYDYNEDNFWSYINYHDNDKTKAPWDPGNYNAIESTSTAWALYTGNRREGEPQLNQFEFFTVTAPCDASTLNHTQSSCNQDVASSSVQFTAQVTTDQRNRKLDVKITDLEDWTLDSFATYYEEPGYYNVSNRFYGTASSSVYKITACLLPSDQFLEWSSYGQCVTILWGNGTGTDPYITYMCESFGICDTPKTGSSSIPVYQQLECDEIGILDVKKGAQCALLWAFEPTAKSVEEFRAVANRMLMIYPLGYATQIFKDVASSTNNSSWAILNTSINPGSWVGFQGVTTTISTINIEQSLEENSNLFFLFDMIMWFIFYIWVVWWGVHRKL